MPNKVQEEDQEIIVQVDVILCRDCDCSSFHYWSHLEAIIRFHGLDSRPLHVCFVRNSLSITENAYNAIEPMLMRNNYWENQTLYTKVAKEKCIQFVEQFKQEYPDAGDSCCSIDSYNFVTNNCSDAVAFVLDYFFCDMTSKAIKIAYKSMQFIFCGPFVALGGATPNCCPAPFFLNTPADVYRRAEALACLYGTKLDTADELGAAAAGGATVSPVAGGGATANPLEEEGSTEPEHSTPGSRVRFGL